MRLTAVSVILPLISVRILAFSWRKHDVSKLFPDVEHPVPEDFIIPDTGLDKDAIGLVDSPYMRKPDCFRRAAGRIRVRCDEMDMDADQRIRAAIAMTLCELRTAEFHSIPLECEVFSEEGGLDDHVPHGICVEALSRSTQSWASYSGYLREIPQLCFAYQRGNEKDLALEIYRNATIEKIAYIRHLMQRAEREVEERTLWQSLLSDLQNTINSLQASPGLADKIYVDISARVLHELQQVIRTQKEVFDVQLQKSREHSLALSEHSRTLTSLSTEFERSFSARLNSGLQIFDNRVSETLDNSDKIWQQLSLMEGGLFSVTNLIAKLAISVEYLSDALNSSVREVEFMNIAQANAVRVTDGLAETLHLMNETVMSALINMNETAIRVTQIIGVDSHLFYSFFLSWARPIVIYLKQTSLLHLIVSTLVKLIWSILRQSPSFLIMPCAIAIVSLIRWFLREILSGQESEYSRPCVWGPKASLDSDSERGQDSSALTSTVTLAARRHPFGRRSSKFSRIPDRLCGRRVDE